MGVGSVTVGSEGKLLVGPDDPRVGVGGLSDAIIADGSFGVKLVETGDADTGVEMALFEFELHGLSKSRDGILG